MQIWFLVFLTLVGACLGSFLCCQARRLHRKLAHQKKLGPRSVCLHCHRSLQWYDNLPIISWLLLRGKCRHCHKKIGSAEFLSELGLATAFLLLGTTIDIITISPLLWVTFLLTLLFTCVIGFLAIYDGLYGKLPTPHLIVSLACAIIILVLRVTSTFLIHPFTPALIWHPLLAVLILGGTYLILYLVSKGRWVGDGDWLLATSIAIVLFEPWLALIALFFTNFLASLIMLPIIKRTKPGHHKIHLGPFLASAFVLTYSFSHFFLSLLS